MKSSGSKSIRFPASVTVEAALALPVFIFILLSFAFLILVLRTHEVVHSSLINAADTMALQYYSKAGFNKVLEGNNELQTEAGRLNNNPSTIMNDFNFNLEKYNYGVDLYKQYLIHEFYKRADPSYGEGNSGQGGPVNISNTAGNDSDPKFDRKKWVDNMLNSYQIEGGFEGIKFAADTSDNPAWKSDFPIPGARISGSNYMTIKVRYEIKIPFPIQTIGKIPVSHCIRVRLWGYGE